MFKKQLIVDYKYYPEPNILPIRLDHQWVESIKEHLPEMPSQRVKKYIEVYGIQEKDAHILVSNKEISDFFEETIQLTQAYRLVCNWLLGDVSAYLNKQNQSLSETRLSPEKLARLITCVQEEIISGKQAKTVFEVMMEEDKTPDQIIEEKGMKQISSKDDLLKMICDILDAHPESVNDYVAGKDRAVKFVVGQVMKQTRGQANPKLTNELLIEELKRRCA